MKKILLTLTMALLAPLAMQAQVLWDLGNVDGNTFGNFSQGGSVTQMADSAQAVGTRDNFPIFFGATRGAVDFTALDSSSQITITAFRTNTSTVGNASFRFVDSGFNLVARYNFNLDTDFSDTMETFTIGTLGAPDITGGGDATDVTTILFLSETGASTSWDFTIDNVTIVPEPTSAALVAAGFAGLLLRRRRA